MGGPRKQQIQRDFHPRCVTAAVSLQPGDDASQARTQYYSPPYYASSAQSSNSEMQDFCFYLQGQCEQRHSCVCAIPVNDNGSLTLLGLMTAYKEYGKHFCFICSAKTVDRRQHQTAFLVALLLPDPTQIFLLYVNEESYSSHTLPSLPSCLVWKKSTSKSKPEVLHYIQTQGNCGLLII